jgi:hypothetical protein
MVFSLVGVLPTIGHSSQERDLMNVSESVNSSARPNRGRTVPAHPRVPKLQHFHHFGTSLTGMAGHMYQHIDD